MFQNNTHTSKYVLNLQIKDYTFSKHRLAPDYWGLTPDSHLAPWQTILFPGLFLNPDFIQVN